ncbi:DUF4097 family beta strand repeat-containing protein [Streptomyces sp. NPDC059785]|uniref:DUF4097 family beta strand repeat-containing protein n=1 Tax=unclassified Streptomyces TaxID=2593676 RepID=UPI00364A1588
MDTTTLTRQREKPKRTRTRTRRLAAALAVLPLAAACGGHDADARALPADAPPELSAAAHLVITTDNGVRLRPSDDDQVVTDRHVHADWSHRDGTWVLDLSCADGDFGRACPRMPEVDVPEGASVSVSARNAGIDVAGVPGALDLTTVNGDVTVTHSGERTGRARLVTRNGSVRVGELRAARLHAETVNGDVDLGCATSPASVTGSTTNGSVRVTVPHDSPAYRVTARTDNGSPSTRLPTAGADDDHSMRLTTVNGDVAAARE